MSNTIALPNYPCAFCRKESEKLCDFVVDYQWTSMKNEQGRMIGGHRKTCDNQICTKCAVKIAGHDFCPSCAKLHEYVKRNHDERPGRFLIDAAFGNIRGETTT